MHSYTKRVTFTPLSRGRYRCNQTGQTLTQKEILGHVNSMLKGNDHVVVGRQEHAKPQREKKGEITHPSKYRAKHR
jgi:hypothetical protein